jgi:hypothetical protein
MPKALAYLAMPFVGAWLFWLASHEPDFPHGD